MKPSDSDSSQRQAKSSRGTKTDTLQEQLDQILRKHIPLAKFEARDPAQSEKARIAEEVVNYWLVKCIRDLITLIEKAESKARLEAEKNCNAVPDDQPNDHHIHYFNRGYKKGKADAIKELSDKGVKESE